MEVIATTFGESPAGERFKGTVLSREAVTED